ncbi:hypothetical protein [Pseudonocardia sp. ICBG601]|uniref:hypothetical protein n=1 Tax=Pseudonocardia sp. ICBG601 TaxID=2846759 RepID=UPI001CF6DF97|nr:hypothetical protein [Pseudonocardia sp. ICBG601]
MEIARLIQIFLIIVLVVTASIKTYDYYRPGPDIPRVIRKQAAWLGISVWFVAVGNILSFPQVSAAIDSVSWVGAGKIVFNGLITFGLGLLAAYFSSLRYRNDRLIRLVPRAAAVVVATMLLLQLITPVELRSHTIMNPGNGYPTIVLSYFIGGAWFIWTTASIASFAFALARKSTKALAGACSLLGLGCTLFALASVSRLVVITHNSLQPPDAAISAINTANFIASSVGQLCAALAIIVFGILRLIDYRQRRWAISHSDTLRNRLVDTIPGVEIDISDNGDIAKLFDQADSPEGQFRVSCDYEKRLFEVIEGLLRISGVLNQFLETYGPTPAPREFAAVVYYATSFTPPLSSQDAAAPSPALLDLLYGHNDSETAAADAVYFLVQVSQELKKMTFGD